MKITLLIDPGTEATFKSFLTPEMGITDDFMIRPSPFIDRNYVVSEDTLKFRTKDVNMWINEEIYLKQLNEMDPKPEKVLRMLKEENDKVYKGEIRREGLRFDVVLLSLGYCDIEIGSIKYLEEKIYMEDNFKIIGRKVHIKKEEDYSERDRKISYTGRDVDNPNICVKLIMRVHRVRKRTFTFDDSFIRILSQKELTEGVIDSNLNSI